MWKSFGRPAGAGRALQISSDLLLGASWFLGVPVALSDDKKQNEDWQAYLWDVETSMRSSRYPTRNPDSLFEGTMGCLDSSMDWAFLIAPQTALLYKKKKQQNPQFLQYGTSSMLELSTFTVQATRELPSPCAASACRSSEHQRECGCC